MLFLHDRTKIVLSGQLVAIVAVMLATFMEVLDSTVVNVSLTHIAGSLSSTTSEATWVLTSYLVANDVVIPISGWPANHFGRKNLFLVSTAGFTAASLLCGIAPTMGLLVTFRVIQGACGGSLQPLSQAVLLEAFPPKQHGKAMGIWAMAAIVVPVLGPVLGGWLTDNFSWRWFFYINLPIGLISVIMIKAFLKDPPYIRRSSAWVDSWGLATLFIWVAGLQIMLDKGQEEDWFDSRYIVFLAVTFAIGLLVWVVRELTTQDPVADLRAFGRISFSAATAINAVLVFVMYGSQLTISLWLQTLLGYPSLQAGVAMVAMGLGGIISMKDTSLFIPQRIEADYKPAILPIFSAYSYFCIPWDAPCNRNLPFSHSSFQIVWVKNLRQSVLRHSLFQGEAGIIEPNLIHVTNASIWLQDDDVLRNDVDKLPKLPFIFPGPRFGPFSVLDIDTCSIPSDNISLRIAEVHAAMKHPAIFPIRPPDTCFMLERLPRRQGRAPPFHHCCNVVGMKGRHPFPALQILEPKTDVVQPSLIEVIKVTVGQTGVDERGNRVDKKLKVHGLGFGFLGGHSVHHTPTEVGYRPDRGPVAEVCHSTAPACAFTASRIDREQLNRNRPSLT